MEALGLGVAALLLIALNAFFVLTEFAIVRIRPTRVAELTAQGDPGARRLQLIQHNLDEHLGVCQVGITLASIALGVVGQRAAELAMGPGAHRWTQYAVAIAVSYVIVSGAHVVLGEMVPKAIAIRMADRAAHACARPLRAFRAAFYPALWLFNGLAMIVTRTLGLPRHTDEERHTEREVRIILEHFQERGQISMRRLLFMENVFDFGTLRAKDVMRPRDGVHRLRAGDPWSANLDLIRSRRFTRYPVMGTDPNWPIGFVHLKDVLLREGETPPDLAELARPLLTVDEGMPLESLLAEMQRKRVHAAIVVDAKGAWSGFVTLEDVIEEIIGTIRDEFEDEDEPVRLSDALRVERIQIGIEAASVVEAVRAAFAKLRTDKQHIPSDWLAHVEEREQTAGTYMGHGVAIPHARLEGLAEPFAMILRSARGIACAGTTERAHLVFVLLTPAGRPRVHQRMLQIIAMMLHEPAIKDALGSASTPEELLEVVHAGEQASLDRPSHHSKLA